jgi:virginiamycin A acetyltransferase
MTTKLLNIIKNIKIFFRPVSNITIMKGAIVSKDSCIGDYSYVGYNTFITKAKIGRYCSIACNVSIGLGEHAIHNISTSSLFYEDSYNILTSKDCIIGNDVWIGVDSIIRRGIEIGNGAIIGANSFVNMNVPAFAIVAGVPAKIIKYRFSEEKITKIEKSSWWNFDINEAKVAISQLEEEIKSKV